MILILSIIAALVVFYLLWNWFGEDEEVINIPKPLDYEMLTVLEKRQADEVRARVYEGVKLLDHQYIGWAQLINLETFDIRLNSQCVLGQLFGDYAKGREQLNIESGVDYGFHWNLGYDEYSPKAEIVLLQNLWYQYIQKKQKELNHILN